jgi:hypothetical protein
VLNGAAHMALFAAYLMTIFAYSFAQRRFACSAYGFCRPGSAAPGYVHKNPPKRVFY